MTEQQATVTAPPTKLLPGLGRKVHWAVGGALLIIVLFAYANSIQADFVYDSRLIVLDSPRLRVVNHENLKLVFTEEYWWPRGGSGLYRPVTTLSYLFNYAVLGNADHPAGYHFINLALHWVNALLVWLLVLALTRDAWVGFFAAAFFAAHPICTEAVTNIVGRADLLAALSVMGGLLLYMKSFATHGWRRFLWLLSLMGVVALGLFSKENAVTICGVIVLYDFVYRQQQRYSNWLINHVLNFWNSFKLGYCVVLAPVLVWLWVRHQLFAKIPPLEIGIIDNSLIAGDFITSRLTAIKIIGKYLWLLLWPQTLCGDYSFSQIPLVRLPFSQWEDWMSLVALGVIVIMIGCAVRSRSESPSILFFCLFFFVTLLPTSNLVVFCGSTMAERFLYLPSVGYAGCLAFSVISFGRYLAQWPVFDHMDSEKIRERYLPACLALIVFCYGMRSFIRNYDWQNNVTFWSQAVAACPNSFKTHLGLAQALFDGDNDHSNIDGAIAAVEKSLAITDLAPAALINAGHYYRIKGDMLAECQANGELVSIPACAAWYTKSIAVLKRAAEREHAIGQQAVERMLENGKDPNQMPEFGTANLYYELGFNYLRLGDTNRALDAFSIMRHLSPTDPAAYEFIGSCQMSEGQLEQGAISLLQAVLLDNKCMRAWNRLLNIYSKIDPAGCAVMTEQGRTKLDPGCPMVRNHLCAAHYDFVRVFLQSRRYGLAQQAKQRALQQFHCPPEDFDKLLPDTNRLAISKPD